MYNGVHQLLMIGGFKSMTKSGDEIFHNVALYIDYENVYKTLRKDYKNIIRLGFFEKLRVWCSEHGKRLIKIAVYCNFDNVDLYNSHHQSLLQNYGVDTIHTSNQGKNYADLKLTIDVLNSMYSNNNIDEFIIMSNDKDMTPLLNTIRENKRKASVLTTGECYNKSICSFSDEQIKFEDIMTTDCDTLDIELIELNFLDGIRNFINAKFSDYKSGAISTKPYPHYAIEYNIDKQSDHFNLMDYELANMIFLHNDEFIYYNYYAKGKKYVALTLKSLKDDFLSNEIIKNTDIIDFDIDKFVSTTYNKYR